MTEVMVNGPDDVFVERGSKHPPIGSPIPMKTTFVRRRGVDAGNRPVSRKAHITWAVISPAVRLFFSPVCPVAQKPQPIAYPAWLEAQTVTRSR
jgi:hypothetical protein